VPTAHLVTVRRRADGDIQSCCFFLKFLEINLAATWSGCSGGGGGDGGGGGGGPWGLGDAHPLLPRGAALIPFLAVWHVLSCLVLSCLVWQG
jgi:hypothetical protein